MGEVPIQRFLPLILVGVGCGGSATNLSGDGDGDGDGDGQGASSDGGGSGGAGHSGTGADGSGATSNGATTGDGGGTGSGGGATGGGATGGQGSGGEGKGGDGGGGIGTGGGSTGVIQEPESVCSTPGALACAGNNQQVALVCSGGLWEVSQVCPASQACDSTPGTTQGTCKDRHPDCVDSEPGEGTCQDVSTLMACGPDNVNLVPLECEGSCFHDQCDNRPNYCPVWDWVLENVNCGTECGETRDTCFLFDRTCAEAPGMLFSPGTTGILRIADYESTCSAKLSDSSCDEAVHGFWFLVANQNEETLRWKVTIPPGSAWKLAAGTNRCPEEGIVGGCLVVGPSMGETVSIFTDDPNATEENVVIEAALDSEPLECP